MPQVGALVRVQETLFDHAVDHRDQRLVEAVHVEEGAGFLADAELAPGQHLEDLLHRAEAAGQGNEAIGQIEHAALAFVHGFDDFELGQAAVGHFPLGQLARDDADHFAAGFQRGIGDGAHQADVAAAVDQLQAVGGDASAEGDGVFGINGLVAGIGAAVDADGFHGFSGIDSAG